MRALVERLSEDHRTTLLADAVAAQRGLVLGAVHGGLAAVLVAAVTRRLGDAAPRLVVCGEPAAVCEDLLDLGVEAVVLPELDEMEDPDELAEHERQVLARRVAACETAHAGGVIVATARAVDQGVPDLARLGQRSLVLRPGDEVEMAAIAERLIDQGYRMSALVEQPGELAVRGGILDVFPLAAEQPLRLEFFGDELESIRRFDPDSQESIARGEQAVLATGAAVVPDSTLWAQLPPGPIWVLADVPLARRLRRKHDRAELRLARQLDSDAEDGASVGVERFVGDRHRELRELADLPAATELLVLARNDEARQELVGLLAEHAITGEVAIGRLAAGWRDLEHDLLVVHDFELAHRAPTRRRANKVLGGAPLDALSDLKPGDYVVHVSNGIARFRGMTTLERSGYLEDFLLLEFADEAKLYVPTTAIDLIQKYVGGSGRHPELSKLGGSAWKRRKARAEKAIEDLTAELLATQAQRSAGTGTGIRHDPDDAVTRRFEAAFPYEETEDQLAAAREIKADMERPEPMDRLLCGDVGFGKTEIAMRAACKAVRSGYQVAVLAPTTLLSEQHATTFGERFAEVELELACLNRFRSTAERREILARTAHGEVDLLIGTHALLTEELRFDNLGLVIVDEEHRFGVKHKERLKQLQSGVDVLTLSATPIPRTLHFSLLGLRDISVLAEAPADRLAIETRVAPWDDKLVRGAIERELERGGQVFVVHNRVKDIDRLAHKLARLVPELRIEVIHGQMDEQRIGRAMSRFRSGALHCLVATSIVESGIDIPNANTLVVNNAHAFGLAELHQIRGRIGRFSRQAYAYFITPPQERMGIEAVRRLDAIQEYAELGAGFKLAMRDLELRGAGNLLGSEQSGHIDAVGYELYCKLLAEAVERTGLASGDAARGESTVARGRQRADGVLAFALDAYVPDTYLDSPSLKFELHKMLDRCRGVEDIRSLARSTRDRYGKPPEPVRRLFQARAIRAAAGRLGITRIELAGRQLRLFIEGSLPAELAAVELPELLHVQSDGPATVLFLRRELDQAGALEVLARLFDCRLEA